MRLSLKSAVAAIALAAATPALASVTILGEELDPGESTVINFNGYSDGGVISGLTSQLTLELVSIIDGEFLFNYSILNNSTAPVTGARISSFGFDTDPDLADAEATGDYRFIESGSMANGQNVEICFNAADTGSCSGGDGAAIGETGTGTFTLIFGSDVEDITLSDLHTRYQSITGVSGASSATGDPVTPPVPEPATWAMMLLGFGATGFALRRRRRTGIAQLA